MAKKEKIIITPEIEEFLRKQVEWANFILRTNNKHKIRSDEVIKLIKNDIKNNDFDYDEIPKYIKFWKKYELYEVCDYLNNLKKP